MEVFKHHIDPGHSWLEVPIQKLRNLGIVNAISEFSYISIQKGRAYLEEDCDLAIFVAAYIEHYGIEPAMVSVKWDDAGIGQGECPIRNYPRYFSSKQITDKGEYRNLVSKSHETIRAFRSKEEVEA